MRPSFAGAPSLAGSAPSSVGSSAPSFSDPSFVSSRGGSALWERVPSAMPSGASPLVQLSRESGRSGLHVLQGRRAVLSCMVDVALLVLELTPRLPPSPNLSAAASLRQEQERGGVLDLPAGVASVPLPLPAHLQAHTLSFRCVPPPAYAAAAAADALPLWSRPVPIRSGAEAQLHVVVPVIPPEERQQGSEEQGEEGTAGSGDAAHLTAIATAGAAHGVAAGRKPTPSGWAPAVAILRLSVHRRGPGGVHVVLESMQSEPPYLLENRTAFPLQYRQVGRPGLNAALEGWRSSPSRLVP